jgi:hypothetical protein
MKRLLFIALALAAPARARDADNTIAPEQVTALQTYFTCIYQQVADLDDGTSDPASLTPKIAPICRYLLGAAATIFANRDPIQRDGWYKKWLALEETQVAKTVWAVRVDRRAAGGTRAAQTASVAPEPVATTSADGKPMSEWRRAYIAKHGHEPPTAK